MNDEPDADQELMQRLAAGDDLALNEIMDRWSTRVAAYLARFLGHDTDAMELAQETFVAVYRARARYRPRARFSTWLFGIASNLARQRLRWRSRHPEVTLDLETTGARELVSPQTPSLDMESVERAAIVRAAILSLPTDLREVVVLSEYEEMPQAEIAGILACSVKTVETRLYRARQVLRKKLARLL